MNEPRCSQNEAGTITPCTASATYLALVGTRGLSVSMRLCSRHFLEVRASRDYELQEFEPISPRLAPLSAAA